MQRSKWKYLRYQEALSWDKKVRLGDQLSILIRHLTPFSAP
jgi:hypothetical protein